MVKTRIVVKWKMASRATTNLIYSATKADKMETLSKNRGWFSAQDSIDKAKNPFESESGFT
jgi:hypothetical protein